MIHIVSPDKTAPYYGLTSEQFRQAHLVAGLRKGVYLIIKSRVTRHNNTVVSPAEFTEILSKNTLAEIPPDQNGGSRAPSVPAHQVPVLFRQEMCTKIEVGWFDHTCRYDHGKAHCRYCRARFKVVRDLARPRFSCTPKSAGVTGGAGLWPAGAGPGGRR